MVDDGNRGRGDHPEGEDRPKEPDRQVGGSEWLLQQLSGGRLKSIFDAPRPAADGSGWTPVDPESATAGAPATDEAASVSEEPPAVPEEPAVVPEESDAAREEPAPKEPAQDEPAHEEPAPQESAPERPTPTVGREEPEATTVHVPPLVAAEASAPPEPTMVLEPTPPLQTSAPGEEREQNRGPEREPDAIREPAPDAAPAPEPERPAEPDAEVAVDRGRAAKPERPAAPVRPQPRFDAARRDPAESTSTARPVPPVAGPPSSAAPPVARDPQRPDPQRDDRPEGATAPSQRDTAPNGTVYQWPDPRGGWDAPPVWEDVVTPPAEPDDDAGDEELWRGTAFAWNLAPTDSGDPSDESDASGPREASSADGADAPFSTTTASAHVNASGEKAPRSKPARDRTPREKTPRAARQKPPRADGPAPSGPTTAGIATEPPSIAPLSPPSPGRTAGRRRLLIALIAVGVVVILAVVAAIGYAVASANRPDAAAPVATQTPTEEASPTPEPTAALPTVGPLPAGTYAWSALLGGECLQPFDSVWAEEFTVVDCAAPHAGQLVAAEPLTEEVFPGPDALALSVASLCQAAGVVDVAAAETYGDVQVSASFPVTQEQWDAGERRSFCFVDREGGDELVGSLAGSAAA